MGRKANAPAAHLTGDEVELSCFCNANQAFGVGWGGGRTISRWVHSTVLYIVGCQVECIKPGLCNFLVYFCSVFLISLVIL